MTMHYDFDGNPITLDEWSELFNSADRHVAYTLCPGDIEVSTIWLGLDYSFGFGVPLIYETMIFGGPLDGEQIRYPNRHAAQAGHDQAVAAVRDKKGSTHG